MGKKINIFSKEIGYKIYLQKLGDAFLYTKKQTEKENKEKHSFRWL